MHRLMLTGAVVVIALVSCQMPLRATFRTLATELAPTFDLRPAFETPRGAAMRGTIPALPAIALPRIDRGANLAVRTREGDRSPAKPPVSGPPISGPPISGPPKSPAKPPKSPALRFSHEAHQALELAQQARAAGAL